MRSHSVDLVCPTYFTYHNALQLYPCRCNGRIFLCFYAWKIFHYICLCLYLYLYLHMYSHIFIHLSISGRSGCLSVLTVVNNAAVYVGVEIALWWSISVFISLDRLLKVDLLDHMVVLFLIFWANFTLFPIVAGTSPQSHQQYTRIPFFPYPRQHFLSCILMMAILTNMRWYCGFIMVFVLIP